MAPLPVQRVMPACLFSYTGLDYAEPFAIRTFKGYGQRSMREYVAVFTCMVTRAVHLEVVSVYTNATFLLPFRHFVARRGLYHIIYSDNGTTFRGAASELCRLFQQTSDLCHEVASAMAQDGVRWTFIPPRSPHFGGLWETAVKAFKYHLIRAVGKAELTFEEMATFCTQDEAFQNSRPLSLLSSDLAALTPGHCLVGTSLTAPPEPFWDIYVSGLPRWIVTLQMRTTSGNVGVERPLRSTAVKVVYCESCPQEGDLVLLTDDQQPPLKWPLARILMLHPGANGLARVATLRTATTTLQRPLVKLVLLPLNQVAAAHHSSLFGAEAHR